MIHREALKIGYWLIFGEAGPELRLYDNQLAPSFVGPYEVGNRIVVASGLGSSSPS